MLGQFGSWLVHSSMSPSQASNASASPSVGRGLLWESIRPSESVVHVIHSHTSPVSYPSSSAVKLCWMLVSVRLMVLDPWLFLGFGKMFGQHVLHRLRDGLTTMGGVGF